jgi:hypothetical protein
MDVFAGGAEGLMENGFWGEGSGEACAGGVGAGAAGVGAGASSFLLRITLRSFSVEVTSSSFANSLTPYSPRQCLNNSKFSKSGRLTF